MHPTWITKQKPHDKPDISPRYVETKESAESWKVASLVRSDLESYKRVERKARRWAVPPSRFEGRVVGSGILG